MGRRIEQLDELIHRLERALCLLLIAAMSLVVFLDVVHRLAATQGPLDRLFSRLLPVPLADKAALAVALGVSFIVLFGALRTAKRSAVIARGRAASTAAAGTALGYALIRLLLALAPNGFIGSQVLALSAMLWVGFLGASIATKDGSHLTLEITEFLWKGRAKTLVGRAGSLAASVFCALLAWLCLEYVRYNQREYAESDGLSGVFDGAEVPKFVVYAIMPWALAVMSLRFFKRAVRPPDEKAPELRPVVAPGPEGGR